MLLDMDMVIDNKADESSNSRFPTSILKIKLEIGIHPTKKVALFEWLIKIYSNKNELVLDNCMGCGTTAIATINTNRNFIGFEKNEMYFEVTNERIKAQMEGLISKFKIQYIL